MVIGYGCICKFVYKIVCVCQVSQLKVPSFMILIHHTIPTWTLGNIFWDICLLVMIVILFFYYCCFVRVFLMIVWLIFRWLIFIMRDMIFFVFLFFILHLLVVLVLFFMFLLVILGIITWWVIEWIGCCFSYWLVGYWLWFY